jgi:hypothetical protein
MVHEAILSATAWLFAARERALDALRNERGQGLMEYAILLGAIAITAGVALYVTNAFDFTDFANTIQGCLDFDETACDFG